MDRLTAMSPISRVREAGLVARAVAVLCAALPFLLLPSGAGADVTHTENMILKTGDTPRLRFEQTGGGFPAQTWDVAGNEANFFVRDNTNGSLLPLRIRPGAPTSSLDIAASGNVGIGTTGPIAPLHIVRAGAVTALYTDTVPDPDVSWATGIPAGGGSFTIGINGSSPVVTVRPFGDLDLLGSLSEAANLASVADVQEVSAAEVLSKLANLPIRSWRFAGAPANARHLGPLSGDFAAAFALGGDASRIAPGDVAGVSLAAAQGLLAQTQALQAQNQGLSAKVQSTQNANKKLTKRVGGVARQLKKLRRAVRKLSK